MRLHDWPMPTPGQLRAPTTHCLRAHGDESRWIAFVDIDEFLFSPTGGPCPRSSADYEQWPGGRRATGPSSGPPGTRTSRPGS